jgi:hypothetical protein
MVYLKKHDICNGMYQINPLFTGEKFIHNNMEKTNVQKHIHSTTSSRKDLAIRKKQASWIYLS